MLGKGDSTVLKQMKDDAQNPFGAAFRQWDYPDADGNMHTSPINIVNDDEDWECGVAKMVEHGAFVIFAEGLDRNIAEPLLPDGAIVVHQGRPPVVELKAGEFSERGLCRLATSMAGRLVRSFVNNVTHSHKDAFLSNSDCNTFQNNSPEHET